MIEAMSDGWAIKHNNRFYHVNETWLAEMYRHQVQPYGNNPAYNRLYAAFQTSDDADEILAKFKDFIENRQKPGRRGVGRSSEFQEFIRQQRGRRANRG